MSATTALPAVGTSRWYAGYVLFILFLTNVFNAIDRAMIAILMPLIQKDLHIEDWQVGLLTGAAFAICYSLFGVPVGRWADRGNRRTILAIGLAVWSGMTALSSLAKNVWMLLIARVGVAAGESTCFPTALPLITDYFAGEKRTRAMAIFQSAVYFVTFFGTLLIAVIGHNYGWRTAFLALGLPGVVLAVIIFTTIKEPQRGAMESSKPAAASNGSMLDAFRTMLKIPGFSHLFTGMVLLGTATFTMGVWAAIFYTRVHGLSLVKVGAILAAAVGLGGMLGSIGGGYLSTLIARKSGDDRRAVLLPAVAGLLAGPVLLLYVFGPLQASLAGAFLGTLLISVYMGPAMSTALSLAPVPIRSLTSSSIMIGQNLIGYGLGPLVVGGAASTLQWTGMAEGASLQWALLLSPVAASLGGLALLMGLKRLPAKTAAA